tara:strand:+ start:51 stop:410 length:360 start_codon:yes stop_codon:yes gene_type:complete
MTKEQKKIYMKAYRLANKEKIAKQSKGYRESNKDRIKLKQKESRDSYKGDYLVYYLPKHNYIGVTNQLYHRLRHHKSVNRDVSNCVTIKTFKDKKNALSVERFYHSIGYEGINPNHKTK